MEEVDFSDIVIVSCGTLSPELNFLRKTGFLNAKKILYTTPGLHERPLVLERQLVERIRLAKKYTDKVIVVYGGKFCYINIKNPTRTMEKIVKEQGEGVVRVRASHCIDMLASEKEREQIAGGEKVWWMTPGWIKYRHFVFKDWDKAQANENFPRHTGGAIVLDAIGFFDRYMEEKPEELLEYSDWMGIPIQAHKISLERFKSLLLEQAKVLHHEKS